MNRAEKKVFVEEFGQKIREASVVYFTDFSGLDVKDITDLRRQIRNSGAECVVVKNRLLRLAVKDMDLPDISEVFSGPTAVILSSEGVVEPAKTVSDFSEEHEDRPVFKLAILGENVLSVEEIGRLAKLPTRDELLAQAVGAMETPLIALAGAFEAKIQEMLGLLDALSTKQEDEV
ncbi:MAG: 50S ribosomal protein L10 [bacterium]|jgi:large subunit ribosomal protein L10